MGWTFTADSEKQTELANNLRTGADNFDTGVTSTYSVIDGMAAGWTGEDYDQFNTNTHGYEKALKDLSDTMRMFGTHYDYIAVGTEELASNCISIIENLTTGNYSVGISAAGTTTGNQGGNQGGNQSGNQGGNQSNDGNGNWNSYEDAAAAGYSNIMTETEFARRKNAPGNNGEYEGCKSYQEYLRKMQMKYSPSTMTTQNNSTGETGNQSQSQTQPEPEVPVAENRVLTRGDVVAVGNGNYNYYGTTEKGTNLYTDSTGKIYYENDGSINPAMTQSYSGWNKYEVQATTSNIGIGYTITGPGGSSTLKSTLTLDGETVQSLDKVTSSVEYQDGEQAPEVITHIN